MNTKEYISSGILEAYCMGALPEAEALQIERVASKHPEIREEIRHINAMLEAYAMKAAVQPPKDNKIKLFHRLYKMDAGPGKMFPPLIEAETPFDEIAAWVSQQSAKAPEVYDSAHIHGLPGDEFVVNFLAWVKDGHPNEVHDSYYEFIVVLEGACTMIYEKEKKDFKKGDIIRIPLDAYHQAVITSPEPMLALVQRQMIS